MILDLSKSLTKFLPVDNSVKRPLWSVMIPNYNNASFLHQAIESVLDQYTDADQMEIYVIDDHSTKGDPEAIVEKYGKGIVKFYQQPVNAGHSKNYDTCIKKSKGRFIHILHEDDLVRKGFYEKMGKMFADFPEIGAAFCRHIFIDEKGNWLWISEMEQEENGILDNSLIKIAEKQRIQYCSMVVKREVYENIGGFINKDISGDGWQMAGEDWEMWVRIAANYKVGYLTEPLAEYRIHRASMTSNLSRTAQNIRDIHKIIERFSSYVPEDKREQVKKSAAKHFANYSFENSKKLLTDLNDPEAAEAQLNEAIKLDPEIYSKNILLYNKLNKLVRHDGISVIVCFENDEDGIKESFDSILDQKLNDGIKSEIIFIDNGSQDNTFKTAKKHTSLPEFSDLPVTLFKQEYTDLNSALKTAIDKAKFDYILVCNGRFRLSSDYLMTGYNILKENRNAALVKSGKELYTDSKLPDWIDRKLLDSRFGILKDRAGAGMNTFQISGSFLRKSVWDDLTKSGTIPYLTDSSEFITEQEAEAELPGMILSNNFKIVNSPDLIYKKYISPDKLEFREFLNFWTEEARHIEKLSSPDTKKKGKHSSAVPGNFSIRRNLAKLKKYSGQIKPYSEENENADLIYFRFYLERIKAILKTRSRNPEKQNSILRKNSGKPLKGILAGYFKNFYRKPAEIGVSVIISCRNGEKLLPQTLSCFKDQKIRDYVNFEIIVAVNDSGKGSENSGSEDWRNYPGRKGGIKVIKSGFTDSIKLAETAVQESKYDLLIFCDDNDLPDENYIQNAVNLFRSDTEIAAAAGSTEILNESDLPDWFGRYKNLFYRSADYSLTSDSDKKETELVFGNSLVLRKKAATDYFYPGAEQFFSEDIMEYSVMGLVSSIADSGKKIIFNPGLKNKKYFSKEEITWDNLRKLIREKGQKEFFLKKRSLSGKIRVSPFGIRKILNDLRKAGYNNLLNYDKSNENNHKTLYIEYNLGKLNSLLKQKTQIPERQIRLIKKGARKKDYRYLHRLTNGFRKRIQRKGVSVVICCYNSAKLLPVTLEHLSRQKTRNYVDWEVVVVNNASSDNTTEVALSEWNKYPGCKGELRVVDQPVPGLSAAREKGIEQSRYEYIIFCDDDNWLDENYIQNVVRVMRSNSEIAIAGCETQEVCEVEPPEWFHKWKNWSYAVGQQFERPGDITWSRGFVWGAGMVLRREALEKLYGEGFKSLLTDRKGKELASGGDTELCYALRLAGWRIWYEPELKLKHYMTAPRLKWDYFLKLWKGFGISTAGLDTYLNVIPGDMIEGNYVEIKKTWNENYDDAKQKLKDIGLKKVYFSKDIPEGDPDMPLIVFNQARLKELKQIRKLYNSRIEETKKAPWKRDFFYLRLANKKYKPKQDEDKTVWPWVDEYDDTDNDRIEENIKISILTPSFLSEDKIEKAIQSVIRQRYNNYEHIIVDGGSKDNTVNILRKYPHLNWVSEKDDGQSDAMNKAFAMSTGDIICYLNSDDFFAPGAFKKVVKEFNLHKETDMVVGNLILEMKSGPMVIYPEKDYKKIMLPFYYSFPINPVSYFYKRRVQEKIGKFPLDNHYTMDFWFLLQAYKDFKIRKIEEILGTFLLHDVNKTSSADNLKNTHETMKQHLKNYDMSSSFHYFYNYYKFRLFNKKSHGNGKSIFRYLKADYFRSVKFSREYSDRIFKKAYDKCYNYSYFKGLVLLMFSSLVYPPNMFKKSRRSLFYRSVLGHKFVEILRNKYYRGIIRKYEIKESLKEKIKLKSRSEVILKAEADRKNIFALMFSGRNNEYSDVIFNIAKENCYNYSYFKGLYYYAKSVLIRPASIFKESRRSLFIRLIFGHRLTEYLRQKYYKGIVKSYEVKSGIRNKVSGRYKFTQRLRFFPRDFYYYFRYRKFKARSKELYDEARISYSKNDKSKTIKLLIPSFALYPPSIFKRNKLSLLLNSFKNGTSSKKNENIEK
ncbi:MAG: glycosyltransferase [Bacteroidetes bacterium]|nr:glycosyltransferase [Bacteroidota bacterium]